MNGWIKMHRKMLDNPIVCKSSDHLSVWVYLLLNAAHEEYPALFQGEKIILKPGQLITGRKAIADFLGINESKVKRILTDFESDQQIDRQRSNKNSLISLINWNKYQSSDQQNDQQMTSKRPADDQQVTTNKKIKNIKKDNKVDNYSLRQTEVSQIIEAWNELHLRPVKRIIQSSKRYQMLMDRLEENGVDDILQAIQKIRDSSYLQGIGENSRKIDLEWFLNPDNFARVLEGYYDDSEHRKCWKEKESAKANHAKSTGFSNFQQRDYNFDDLEQRLLDSQIRPDDRFSVLDAGLRQEMEKQGIIIGQEVHLENGLDDLDRYLNWLSDIELMENERIPEIELIGDEW